MSKIRAEVNRHLPDKITADPAKRAAYVIEHSIRQEQRGRQPSLSFNGIGNPREALKAAHAARRAEKAETATRIEAGENPVVCQEWKWMSSTPERDGVSLHTSVEDRDEFVRAYWDTMPDYPMPQKYACPEGEPITIGVSDELLLTLQEADASGIRLWQAAHPSISLPAAAKPLPIAA
jgi:hypothetical protein